VIWSYDGEAVEVDTDDNTLAAIRARYHEHSFWHGKLNELAAATARVNARYPGVFFAVHEVERQDTYFLVIRVPRGGTPGGPRP
jgi:hypothetical protein